MPLTALCNINGRPFTKKINDFCSPSKNTIAFPSPYKRAASKAAQPLQDPHMVKQISDYLVSLDKPWAYRMNAIWCLGVIAGCRASAMVRHGKDGRIDPDDDYTPMFIRDVLETPAKFKNRIVLHERKTGKESSILLVPFVKEAIALYLKKCRPGFKLSEPLFNGREAPYQAVEVRTVNNDMAKIKKALNIQTNFTSHTMRKTFAHYSAAIIMKLRQEGLEFGSENDLSIINVSTCHYNKNLTRHYAGWSTEMADAARNELSKYFQAPHTLPQVTRLHELATQFQNDDTDYFGLQI